MFGIDIGKTTIRLSRLFDLQMSRFETRSFEFKASIEEFQQRIYLSKSKITHNQLAFLDDDNREVKFLFFGINSTASKEYHDYLKSLKVQYFSFPEETIKKYFTNENDQYACAIAIANAVSKEIYFPYCLHQFNQNEIPDCIDLYNPYLPNKDIKIVPNKEYSFKLSREHNIKSIYLTDLDLADEYIRKNFQNPRDNVITGYIEVKIDSKTSIRSCDILSTINCIAIVSYNEEIKESLEIIQKIRNSQKCIWFDPENKLTSQYELQPLYFRQHIVGFLNLKPEKTGLRNPQNIPSFFEFFYWTIVYGLVSIFQERHRIQCISGIQFDDEINEAIYMKTKGFITGLNSENRSAVYLYVDYKTGFIFMIKDSLPKIEIAKYPSIVEMHTINGKSVMPLYRYKSLKDIIYDINNTQKSIIVFGLLMTISKLQEQGIVHYDIREDNVLIDHNFQPILTDFDFSWKEKSQIDPRASVSQVFHPTLDRPDDIYQLAALIERLSKAANRNELIKFIKQVKNDVTDYDINQKMLQKDIFRLYNSIRNEILIDKEKIDKFDSWLQTFYIHPFVNKIKNDKDLNDEYRFVSLSLLAKEMVTERILFPETNYFEFRKYISSFRGLSNLKSNALIKLHQDDFDAKYGAAVQYQIAQMYDGVDIKAFEHYLRAASYENNSKFVAKANTELGKIFLYSKYGIIVDEKRALDYFILGAKYGDPEAKFMIAEMMQSNSHLFIPNDKMRSTLYKESLEMDDDLVYSIAGLKFLTSLSEFRDPMFGLSCLESSLYKYNIDTGSTFTEMALIYGYYDPQKIIDAYKFMRKQLSISSNTDLYRKFNFTTACEFFALIYFGYNNGFDWKVSVNSNALYSAFDGIKDYMDNIEEIGLRLEVLLLISIKEKGRVSDILPYLLEYSEYHPSDFAIGKGLLLLWCYYNDIKEDQVSNLLQQSSFGSILFQRAKDLYSHKIEPNEQHRKLLKESILHAVDVVNDPVDCILKSISQSLMGQNSKSYETLKNFEPKNGEIYYRLARKTILGFGCKIDKELSIRYLKNSLNEVPIGAIHLAFMLRCVKVPENVEDKKKYIDDIDDLANEIAELGKNEGVSQCNDVTKYLNEEDNIPIENNETKMVRDSFGHPNISQPDPQFYPFHANGIANDL
ncbi:hypothetical protein TVAG_046580 [Trichomonas vaginalis G3]|uniref:Protein kinase domain-containing protein n=1 Tax=Trichomonas vaginalis (strain ATCC PRA-98 / G3) TaxID=412133 RepID=A2EAN3_TRIV3|nr:protein kinase-like (PK-like) family [Trichomonas vaginalis G3]EAY10236.1 hypothetical protein TVAG_046580 [Trichomonas vaginalis G3]KAI5487718.1 protein kinase-like (PK-like) family [Trichomonas vaginalis G3]|eukprot:XP_001322459.1 hypothetical protein [Trichomonas vaginalis G3]